MLIPISLLLILPSLLSPPAEDARADANSSPKAKASPSASEPLMPWQRNLDDALALSKASGKPLLICVNSDGESASEQLAANQYRDPKFIALVQGFIPVLASPSSHQSRDFDDFGGRLEDPKFGRLVESEHLEIEPVLYKSYFNARRVAPRHVGVSPDGTILFDLFLLHNLGIIDSTLAQHGVFQDPQRVEHKGLLELLESHDHLDRQRLEAHFMESSLAERVELIDAAFSRERSAQHPQLVRLAFASGLSELSQAAVQAVLQHPSAGVEFMQDAFRIAEGQPELQRDLARAMSSVELSAGSNVQKLRLNRQLEVIAGLSARPSSLDAGRWLLALRMLEKSVADSIPQDADELAENLIQIEVELRQAPLDAGLHQLHARALLGLAKLWITDGGGNPTYVLSDAMLSAERAIALGTDMPLANAALAHAAYLSSDLPRAKLAAAAALPGLQAWAGEALASDVLDLFAKLRTREVYSAFNSQTKMSAEAIADVCAIHEILLAHPRGTATQAIEYLNFLNTIGGSAREERVVRLALERFGDNGTLHGYLRHYVLRDRGAAGMQSAYDGLKLLPEFRLDGAWYAALAVLVAAERHAQEQRLPQALDAYLLSIEQFQRVLESNPDFAASSKHYIGIAYAGMARQLTDTGDLDGALEYLRAAATASITCFGAKDGLERIPKQTVSELSTKLRRIDRGDDADRFVADLRALGLEL